MKKGYYDKCEKCGTKIFIKKIGTEGYGPSHVTDKFEDKSFCDACQREIDELNELSERYW